MSVGWSVWGQFVRIQLIQLSYDANEDDDEKKMMMKKLMIMKKKIIR